jgi:hypothetical protein
MTVQSARVQEVVRGDDALLFHQVISTIALDAMVTDAPVQMNSGDSAVCWYAAQQTDGQPLVADVNAPALPNGAVPTSRIQVQLSQAQTAVLNIGPAQTVRVEIIRSNGLKETHYLYQELDVIDRGFPMESEIPNLP